MFLELTELILHFTFSPSGVALNILNATLIWPLLTSDITLYQTSLRKNNSLHHILATYTTQSFDSMGFLFGQKTHPDCIALYVICVPQARIFPSDSTLRWTPCCSANGSYRQPRSRLSPPNYYPCQAHHSSTGNPVVFCPSG